MTVYRLGSRGAEVLRFQERLKELDHYQGPLDGHFGGGTQAAVKTFQSEHALVVDGLVGPQTWKALLFKRAIKEPAIAAEKLAYRCLAVTAAFETGKGLPDCFTGLNGDFDGQGLSYGVLQWNFGQQTLQPLLKEMLVEQRPVMEAVFHQNSDTLVSVLDEKQDEQLAFARTIQHPVRHYIYEPWRGMFKALGRTREFQDLQVKHAHRVYRGARKYCRDYGLWSERAVALMFDIRVQNGSIPRHVQARIRAEIAELPASLPTAELEVRKLRIVAQCRAEAANPRWVEDVRARKLCIADGEGTVHGINYNLQGQYGLRMRKS